MCAHNVKAHALPSRSNDCWSFVLRSNGWDIFFSYVLPLFIIHRSNGSGSSLQLIGWLMSLLLIFWFLPPWKIFSMFKGFDLWTFCCELDYLGSLLCSWKHYPFWDLVLRISPSSTHSLFYPLWAWSPRRFRSPTHSLRFWDFVKLRSEGFL
jgi:hypothetical protein